MTAGFQFNRDTVASLRKVLGEAVFAEIREALERAAVWVTPPPEAPGANARQKRAKRRMHALFGSAVTTLNQLDPYTRFRMEQMLVGEFGLGAAELQRLMVYLLTLTKPSQQVGPGPRSLFPQLTALGVAMALKDAGIRLGTAERSKFGIVLALVLQAGDPTRWGSDVRRLQKHAIATLEGIPAEWRWGDGRVDD